MKIPSLHNLLFFATLFLFFFLSFQQVEQPSTSIEDLVTRGEMLLEASDYDSALIYLEQAEKEFELKFDKNFTTSSALLFLKIQNLISDGIAHISDREESIRILEVSLNKVLPHISGDELEVANNYYLRGQIYRVLRKLPEAEAFLFKAKPIYEKQENFIELVKLTNELGRTAYNNYDYENSEAYGLAALELAKSKLGEDHYELVAILNLLGNTSTDINQMEKGRDYYLDALRILKKNRAEPHNFFGMLYDNLARYHKISGNWDSVQHYAALTLNNDIKIYGETHEYIARSYGIIGVAHRMQRQFLYAREYFERALAIRIKNFGEIHNNVADNYMDLGLVNNNIGNYDEALTYYQKALPIYLKTVGNNNENIGVCYQNIGDVYLVKGDSKTAFDYYNKALRLFKRIEHKHREQSAYINLGMAHFNKNDLTNGEKYFLKAIEGYRTIYPEKNARIATVYRQLSQELKEKGIYEEALTYIHAAINELILGKNIENIQQSISAQDAYLGEEILYTCIAEKAEILHKISVQNAENDLERAAQQHYLTAIDLLYKTLRNVKRSTDKNIMVNNALRIFEGGIGTVVNLSNDASIAFKLSERYKSILLLQSIREAEAVSTANFPVAITDQINISKNEITEYEKLLFEQNSKPGPKDSLKIAALKGDMFKIRSRFDSLNRILETDYPQYYDSKYNDEVATVENLQRELTENQTLLEYFVGDSTIYAFTISKNDYQIHEIKKDFPLEKLVRQLQTSTYTYHLSGTRSDKILQTYADTLVAASHELYNKIFAPIAKTINLPEQLIIVPDGVLGYVPFELLLSELPEDNSFFGTHRYLLHDHQISYTYSATLLREMQQKKHRETKGDFLAFAPTFESEVVYADASRSINDIRGALSPLTYNIPEVEALQKMIGGKIFTGLAATEDNFNTNAPDYKIIHLATHGKANDRIGDYAYLAFTEVEDSLENELLYNRDLYNLRLNADLVVLSACETGIGELQKGEGIISLARGFSYAGAKSIITTLWSVNDQKTKELMENFYDYIKKGYEKDNALRQAKLDFIQKYSHEAHPFFWASFVPVGDMSAIELSSNLNWWIFGGVAFLIMLLVPFLLRRNNKS